MVDFYLDDYNLICCDKKVSNDELTLFVNGVETNFNYESNDKETLLYLNEDFNENKHYQIFYKKKECLLIQASYLL